MTLIGSVWSFCSARTLVSRGLPKRPTVCALFSTFLRVRQANGITLTFIEKSGLIQAAENLGLLSKISDRCAAHGLLPAPTQAHKLHSVVGTYSLMLLLCLSTSSLNTPPRSGHVTNARKGFRIFWLLTGS